MYGKKRKNYGKVSMGVVRTTYLIDENGIIIKANDKVKAADDPEKNVTGIKLMKIILSPAKKMKVDTDSIDTMSSPVFLEKAEEILGGCREERKKN